MFTFKIGTQNGGNLKFSLNHYFTPFHIQNYTIYTIFPLFFKTNLTILVGFVHFFNTLTAFPPKYF